MIAPGAFFVYLVWGRHTVCKVMIRLSPWENIIAVSSVSAVITSVIPAVMVSSAGRAGRTGRTRRAAAPTAIREKLIEIVRHGNLSFFLYLMQDQDKRFLRVITVAASMSFSLIEIQKGQLFLFK